MTTILHQPGCRYRGTNGQHSDAAKRIHDQYHLHRTVDLYGSIGHWIACALSDGTSDGVLYDSKSDAVHHQHHNEQFYTFIQITMANLSVCDAEVFLTVTRRLYDKGMRMVDPDHAKGGRELIKRTTREDQLSYLKLRPTGLTWPGE